MTIRSKVPTKEYKDGWDAVFVKHEGKLHKYDSKEYTPTVTRVPPKMTYIERTVPCHLEETLHTMIDRFLNIRGYDENGEPL